MAHVITRIPRQYHSGFAKIKTLSSPIVATLRQAVDASPSTVGIKQIASAIENQLTDLNRDDIETVVKTLYSLYVFRASAGPDTSIEDIVSSVVNAMQTSGEDSLALANTEKARFRKNLTLLLGSKVLETSSKVEQLKTDYPNLLYDAKIITDIRPIFSDPSGLPVATTIAHTLKLVYHESAGEHKELYLALDAEDLKTLKLLLVRAESKEASLKGFLKQAKLSRL